MADQKKQLFCSLVFHSSPTVGWRSLKETLLSNVSHPRYMIQSLVNCRSTNGDQLTKHSRRILKGKNASFLFNPIIYKLKAVEQNSKETSNLENVLSKCPPGKSS